MALANSTPYGLSAIVYTSSQERAERVGRAIRAGIVWVNTFLVRDLTAPFGGIGISGIGREGGDYALDFHSDLKTLQIADGHHVLIIASSFEAERFAGAPTRTASERVGRLTSGQCTSSRPSGAVEPDVDLAGADRVLVVAVADAGGDAVATADRPDHHQVVAEHRLGLVAQELGHRVDDGGVVAGLQPGQALEVGRPGLRRADVHRVGRLVGAQLLQLPERVAHRPAGQQHDPPTAALDGPPDRLADEQEVVALGRLGRAHADPPLVALQERQEVRRRVVDRQARVVDRRHPRAGRRDLLADQLGQLGVAREVVGHLRHALAAAPPTCSAPTGGRGRRRRTRPSCASGRRTRRSCRAAGGRAHSAFMRCSPGTRLISWPSLSSRRIVLGQHDRRHVGDQRGTDDWRSRQTSTSSIDRRTDRSRSASSSDRRSPSPATMRRSPSLNRANSVDHQRLPRRRAAHQHPAPIGTVAPPHRRGHAAPASSRRRSASPCSRRPRRRRAGPPARPTPTAPTAP